MGVTVPPTSGGFNPLTKTLFRTQPIHFSSRQFPCAVKYRAAVRIGRNIPMLPLEPVSGPQKKGILWHKLQDVSEQFIFLDFIAGLWIPVQLQKVSLFVQGLRVCA